MCIRDSVQADRAVLAVDEDEVEARPPGDLYQLRRGEADDCPDDGLAGLELRLHEVVNRHVYLLYLRCRGERPRYRKAPNGGGAPNGAATRGRNPPVTIT